MNHGSEDIIYEIINNRMYLKFIRYEYQHNKNYLIKKPQGTFDYALSESYYERIRKELKYLDEIVQKLSFAIDSNFKIDVKVLPNGKLDLEHLHIQISRSFAFRDSKGDYNKPQALMLHDTIFNILIFVDYINDVHLYSTNYLLSHCEVFMVASIEDILYVTENVSVPQKCFNQWNQAIMDFSQFAKKQYACSVNIPCDEGELCFENRIYGLSQREFISNKVGG
ncbi:hypothetical protein D7X33_19225 [Butyricicoccus sp. 1XD8-22]|nr:hypothetical protein D7X33_19225 [Butyricicoccus sp. 1XD8-22]